MPETEPRRAAKPAGKPRGTVAATLAALLAALLSVLALQGAPARAATWQLSGNLGAHDPTILHEGGTWWVATTGAGIPMKYSADGRAWTQGTPIFRSELPWWRTYAPTMGANDVWAPDMHAYNGRVWMYYSVSEFGKNQSAIGLTSAPTVASGSWRDDGLVIASAPGRQSYNAIDPDLFFDAGGAPWLVFGSWFSGIYVTRLDPSTMKPTGGLTKIAARSNGIEGANIVYSGGYYYLFASIDKCCQGVNSTYKIAYARSASITGPYTDAGGTAALNGGGTVLESTHGDVIGPGGQSVVRNGSGWLIIRHYYDGNNNGAPTMLISDLYFDSAGWPTYTAGGGPTSPSSSSPGSSPSQSPSTSPSSGPGSSPSSHPSSSPPASGSCEVAYTVTSTWAGGFGANVTITDTGATPVNGWSLAWTFPDGQTITQIWSATATTSGAKVTATDAGYNAAIPANGGSTYFGFNATWTSTNNPPTAFTLNGTACAVG